MKIKTIEEPMKLHHVYQLTTILGRAQHLATLVLLGDTSAEDYEDLANEVAGELSELIELLEGRESALDDADCVDPALIELASQLRGDQLIEGETK